MNPQSIEKALLTPIQPVQCYRAVAEDMRKLKTNRLEAHGELISVTMAASTNGCLCLVRTGATISRMVKAKALLISLQSSMAECLRRVSFKLRLKVTLYRAEYRHFLPILFR